MTKPHEARSESLMKNVMKVVFKVNLEGYITWTKPFFFFSKNKAFIDCIL